MAEKEQEKNQFVKQVAEQKYEFGFTTDVHTEIIEKGLNEDVVRLISQKKGEPDWMLEFRLKAYNYWKTLKEPKWGHVHVPPIDYQEISYYADPLAKKPKNKEIDPELEKTFDKLVEHGNGQLVEVLILINQSDKTVSVLFVLLIALDSLFQNRDFGGKLGLLLFILSVQSGISAVRQLA